MLKIKAREIAVDSGIIIICDKDYFKNQKKEVSSCLYEEFEVPLGKYICKWKMKETWNGEVSGEALLEVSSGKILVVDPCYMFDDDNWTDELNKTNYYKNPVEGTVILDKHGGDGFFDIYITLIPK